MHNKIAQINIHKIIQILQIKIIIILQGVDKQHKQIIIKKQGIAAQQILGIIK